MRSKTIEFIGAPGVGKSSIYKRLCKKWHPNQIWIYPEALLGGQKPPIARFKNWIDFSARQILHKKMHRTFPENGGFHYIQENEELANFYWKHFHNSDFPANKDISFRFRAIFYLYRDFCKHQAIQDAATDKLCILNEGLLQKSFLIHDDVKIMQDLLDESELNTEELEYLGELQKEFSKNFNVYIALIHYPVYNKDLKKIVTAFTNLDAHDIARAGKTYGVKKFYLVNPVSDQRELVKKVIDHWTVGPGVNFNPTRKEALEIVEVNESIEEIIDDIEKTENVRPKVVVTDARIKSEMVGYKKLREKIFNDDKPFLILFGTGWGLVEEVINSADYILKPIKGYNDFNHLSVRSAAAIILDRLLSSKI